MALEPKDFFILVVDDEESIRKVLSDYLAAEGFRVDTAGSGEEALAKAEKQLPHIVLTDIRMPGMSGIELMSKVRAMSEEVQVVIMTSHASLETALEAMRLGAYDYLSKPFGELEDVLHLIVRVAQKIYLAQENQYLTERMSVQNDQLRHLNEDIADTNKGLQQLNDYAERLSLCATPKETLSAGVTGLSEAIRGLPVVFFRVLLAKRQCAAQAFANIPEKYCIQLTLPLEAASPADLCQEISNLASQPSFQKLVIDSFQLQSPSVTPVIFGEHPLGLLVIDRRFPLSAAEEQSFRRHVSHFTIALSNSIFHHQVNEMATKDWLTGLTNIRTFRELIEEEIKRAFRLRHPLSVLFIDIDYFKKLNDTHGHATGDCVLRSLGKLLKNAFRSHDIVARYGGEEFVVALPHTPLEGALRKAEQFREQVSQTLFEGAEKQPLGKMTVSMGVSCYPTHGNSSEEVLKAADAALYQSKHSGRNCVTSAEEKSGHIPSFSPVMSD